MCVVKTREDEEGGCGGLRWKMGGRRVDGRKVENEKVSNGKAAILGGQDSRETWEERNGGRTVSRPRVVGQEIVMVMEG